MVHTFVTAHKAGLYVALVVVTETIARYYCIMYFQIQTPEVSVHAAIGGGPSASGSVKCTARSTTPQWQHRVKEDYSIVDMNI